jgi:alanine transaminase
MATTTPSRLRALDINHIKPHVREANYVLGGELAARAEAYRIHFMKMANGLPSLSKGESLAFDRVINANLGNPQLVGQRPITFFRQVLSLLEHPPLIERSDLLIKELGYQPDAIARAQWLLRECGGVGIYSNSQGVPAIRKSVAEFIERMLIVYFVPSRAHRASLTDPRT